MVASFTYLPLLLYLGLHRFIFNFSCFIFVRDILSLQVVVPICGVLLPAQLLAFHQDLPFQLLHKEKWTKYLVVRKGSGPP